MSNFRKITIFCLAIAFNGFFLSSCSFTAFLGESALDSEAVAQGKATIIARMTMTAAPLMEASRVALTPEVTETTEIQCAYAWAVNPDPVLSDEFQKGFSSSDQALFKLGVSWYGENCVQVGTNKILEFSPIDLELTLDFSGRADSTDKWMGEQIARLVPILQNTLEKRPELSRYPIRYHFLFGSPKNIISISFDTEAFENAKVKLGLQGADLVQALRN